MVSPGFRFRGEGSGIMDCRNGFLRDGDLDVAGGKHPRTRGEDDRCQQKVKNAQVAPLASGLRWRPPLPAFRVFQGSRILEGSRSDHKDHLKQGAWPQRCRKSPHPDPAEAAHPGQDTWTSERLISAYRTIFYRLFQLFVKPICSGSPFSGPAAKRPSTICPCVSFRK